jgi:hypothetical protein
MFSGLISLGIKRKLPMRDILLMHIIDGQKQLPHDNGRSSLVKGPHLANTLVKLSSLNQLRNDIVVLLILKQLENPHNVWMCLYKLQAIYSFFEHLELVVHEINENLVFLDLLFLDYLDGTRHLGLQMARSPYFPERTLTDGVLQLVDFVNVFRLFETLKVLERYDLSR